MKAALYWLTVIGYWTTVIGLRTGAVFAFLYLHYALAAALVLLSFVIPYRRCRP